MNWWTLYMMGGIKCITDLSYALCYFTEESSVQSDSTVEADTNTEPAPASLKQPNLTLELFPNHSENLESAKKVKSGLCEFIWTAWQCWLRFLIWFCSVCLHSLNIVLFTAAESFGEDQEVIDWKVFPSTGTWDESVCSLGGALWWYW